MRKKAIPLTIKQTKIFALYYIHNCKQAQIAAMLGISQPAVSQHIKGIKKAGFGLQNISTKKISKKTLSLDEARDYKIIKAF